MSKINSFKPLIGDHELVSFQLRDEVDEVPVSYKRKRQKYKNHITFARTKIYCINVTEKFQTSWRIF